MDIESSTVFLVYFYARGTAQPIRNLLYELNAQFQEIIVDQTGKIPESLVQRGVDLNNIPCIVHGERMLSDLYPVQRYLCRLFNRTDLLGKNLNDQTRVSQFMNCYMQKKSKKYTLMINYVTSYLDNRQQKEEIKNKMFEALLSHLTFVHAGSEMYIGSGNFLLGYLTVIDLAFYQSCFYMANMFKEQVKKKFPILLAYKNFIEQTEFYQKNKEKIDKYPILMPHLNKQLCEGFKQLWEGNKKYFQLKEPT